LPYVGRLDDLIAAYGVYWLMQRLRARMAAPHTTTGASQAGGNTAGAAHGQEEAAAAPHASLKNPWQVLQLEPGATPEAIHTAYKTLLLKYHPDRVAHLGEEFQRLAHRKTLEIQQAYAMLKQC
jgi:DnaJ like chaperone protein